MKFCGLTRAEDAAQVVALGGGYAGVIFADGPRLLTPRVARDVLAPVAGTAVRRVGVFGAAEVDDILRNAVTVGLDVLQLSGPMSIEDCGQLRARFDGQIWKVVRIRPDAREVSMSVDAWFDCGVDAVALDALVDGQAGGTGVRLNWAAIARDVRRLRSRGRVVLAGGLRPENVAEAVLVVMPDVVDVSSGVEVAPGIKDPERMRAFATSVRALEA